MKTLSPAFAAHLSGELATLATLVKITRANSVVQGFTSHDRDITVDDITYRADSAFTASAVESRATLSTDNLDLLGMLSDDGIAASDLMAGRYDHARIDVYLCNWADLTQGVMQLRRGWLGEVKIRSGQYEAEVRGLLDLLQRPVGHVFSLECRHRLGDAACTVDLSAQTVTGSVTSVTDASLFIDAVRSEDNGMFDYGLLTWTSGMNDGLAMEVRRFEAGGAFTLFLPMPFAVAAGDAYSVYKGCDKRAATCKEKFANFIHFGGFPHLPGIDRLLDYPDARS
jgi:uncharacterized phage protein (TIGR02218 family)